MQEWHEKDIEIDLMFNWQQRQKFFKRLVAILLQKQSFG